MSRTAIVAGLLVFVLAAAKAHAQLPTPGSTGMRYEIVGPATSPLAAPIPTTNFGPPKPSIFARLYGTLAKFFPFLPGPKTPIAPQMPTTQLPNQGPGVQIQQTGGLPFPQPPQ